MVHEESVNRKMGPIHIHRIPNAIKRNQMSCKRGTITGGYDWSVVPVTGVPPAVIRCRLSAPAVEHSQLIVDPGQLGLCRVHWVVERMVVVMVVVKNRLRQVLRRE